MSLGSISLSGGLVCLFAGHLGAHFRAHDLLPQMTSRDFVPMPDYSFAVVARQSARAGGGTRTTRQRSVKMNIMKTKCARCDDTGWVCEAHIMRPWNGPNACNCSAPGAPCGRCNVPKDGARPRLPDEFEVEFDKMAGGIERWSDP
jgi:hypothetical protein